MKITEEVNADAVAEGVCHPDALRAGPTEYRAESAIDLDGRAWFGGWVTTAVLTASAGVEIRARSGPGLVEKRLGGLAHAGMTSDEIVWSMGRIVGFTEEHLHIPGLKRTPDRFEVLVPVRGVALDSDLDLGQVTITVDRSRVEAALSFVRDGADFASAFLAPSAWATTWIDGEMVYDAEQWAWRRITGALDRVALEAQYSLAFAPNGDLPPYDRSALFTDPTADPLVLVLGSQTGRRWLRGIRDVPFVVPLAERRVRLATPTVGSDRHFDEALGAWRRAIHAADQMEAVGAIWEAIEFYTAKTSVPSFFTKTERKKIREALGTVPMTEQQRQRISTMVDAGSVPPLLLRLREALTRDNVPFTDDEIDALSRVRKSRNDFVHGVGRANPDPNDLQLSLALVNRMLAFRAGSA